MRNKLFALGHSSDDLEAIERELQDYLVLMRISVTVIKVVAVDVLDINVNAPMTEDARGHLTKLRQTMMAAILSQDFDASSPEAAGDGLHHQRTESTASFVNAWVGDVEDISSSKRRDLFLKAHTVAQLKRALDEHSSGEQTDLVIINMPVPHISSELTGHRRTSLFMELIEFLTSNLSRVV
ncbi:hypothetical protein HK102_005393 [Quaeritorhiza haematococci]|nr:hypothetical protein HK102_005393 [Quaeritorhiza haematococci]